jgi:type II secretory pathway pseudopilin PulG
VSPSRSRRHRAQAGTTLIELLVSTVIIGVALVLLVGIFSTGVIDSNLAKRESGAQAATQYELNKIDAKQADSNGYSECFASDGSGNPTTIGLGARCPSAARIRVDVSASAIQVNGVSLERWTIQANTWPSAARIGSLLSVYRVAA